MRALPSYPRISAQPHQRVTTRFSSAVAASLLVALLPLLPLVAPAGTSVPASPRTSASGGSGEGSPWVSDDTRYHSPWYDGDRRIWIRYGCTRAPYYSPDPRCVKDRSFHHGLDMKMPCGTPLYSAVRGRVVRPSSAGALGPAYGAHAFRIRSAGLDYVIAHARRAFVEPGEWVRRGQRIARASDDGAPDGCHLHFEVRPAGEGYTAAVAPRPYARLSAG